MVAAAVPHGRLCSGGRLARRPSWRRTPGVVGRLQEGLAWPPAAGRVQPAQVLAADLTGEPGAELLADVGHRGPGERAGLLDAQPANLQALDLAGAPTVHHRK